MYKLVFFVPEEQKEKVKNALFSLGAGTSGYYARCSWECAGTGQFMPMEGASPNKGQQNRLETMREFRVEMLVPEDLIHLSIETLLVHHPYETPAYEFYKTFQVESELEGENWL